MTSHRQWLVDFDHSKKSKMRFPDDITVPVEGVGNILIKKKDGKNALISDVLYVLEMRSNLQRIGQLLSRGFTVHMEKECLEVYDRSQRRILSAPLLENKTFQVQIQAAEK